MKPPQCRSRVVSVRAGRESGRFRRVEEVGNKSFLKRRTRDICSWQAIEYAVGSPAGRAPERGGRQWTKGARPAVSSGPGGVEVAGEVEELESVTGGCAAAGAGTSGRAGRCKLSGELAQTDSGFEVFEPAARGRLKGFRGVFHENPPPPAPGFLPLPSPWLRAEASTSQWQRPFALPRHRRLTPHSQSGRWRPARAKLTGRRRLTAGRRRKLAGTRGLDRARRIVCVRARTGDPLSPRVAGLPAEEAGVRGSERPSAVTGSDRMKRPCRPISEAVGKAGPAVSRRTENETGRPDTLTVRSCRGSKKRGP